MSRAQPWSGLSPHVPVCCPAVSPHVPVCCPACLPMSLSVCCPAVSPHVPVCCPACLPISCLLSGLSPHVPVCCPACLPMSLSVVRPISPCPACCPAYLPACLPISCLLSGLSPHVLPAGRQCLPMSEPCPGVSPVLSCPVLSRGANRAAPAAAQTDLTCRHRAVPARWRLSLTDLSCDVTGEGSASLALLSRRGLTAPPSYRHRGTDPRHRLS